MKILKLISLAVLMTALTPAEVSAKKLQPTKAYIFGFIANFTDSVVYFTDIQEVDSVCIDKKKFLLGRSDYAGQLRNYFAESLKQPHRTCVVSYGLTRKEAEKKYVKMKKLYAVKHAGHYDIKYLNENEFRFTSVSIDMDEEMPAARPKKSRDKKDKKDNKRRPPMKRN